MSRSHVVIMIISIVTTHPVVMATLDKIPTMLQKRTCLKSFTGHYLKSFIQTVIRIQILLMK